MVDDIADPVVSDETPKIPYATKYPNQARYKAKNKAKLAIQNRAYALQWAKDHPERHKANKAAFYKRHKAEILAQQKQYFLEHPDADEARRQRMKDYRETHREEQRAYDRTHLKEKAARRKANPEQHTASEEKRRAAKMNAPLNDFTAAQWKEMQIVYAHRCVYCQKRCKGHLTQDHITPLIKGGSHTAANIVPACQSCNSRKHTGPVPIPVQTVLLLAAPALPHIVRKPT